MTNINKLKGRIVECGMTMQSLAASTGISQSALYRRIAGEGKDFTLEEIQLISVALDMTIDDINQIFFADFVA